MNQWTRVPPIVKMTADLYEIHGRLLKVHQAQQTERAKAILRGMGVDVDKADAELREQRESVKRRATQPREHQNIEVTVVGKWQNETP